ncbi:UNVERIFIED_CONTAM: hypothetical protein Scaly_2501400 [Sesamum calycinum]|uniref:CCHC-type domain-containing protein n=1 Tax=Sesamum calycinum TaxID=2727403 RepID=A0AAW2LSB9_9LAMI
MSDRNKALERCPWTFDKNEVILNRVTTAYNPMDVDLNIHGLPLRMMTKEVAEVIGNRIVVFLESDRTQGRGETIMASFTYERLPIFCYGCGILGHIVRDCSERLENLTQGASEEETLQYGSWLRELV